MHITDIFILFLTLLGAYLGTRKDLAHMAYHLFRMAATLFLAVHYHQGLAGKFLEGQIMSPPVAAFLAFAVVSLLVFFSCTALILFLTHIVEIKFIACVERPLGLILGMCHMIVLSAWLLILAMLLPLPVFSQAITGGSLAARGVLDLMEPGYHSVFHWFPLKPAFDANSFNSLVSNRMQPLKPD